MVIRAILPPYIYGMLDLGMLHVCCMPTVALCPLHQLQHQNNTPTPICRLFAYSSPSAA